MIEAEKRKAIFLLHQEGLSDYELAGLFRVSRNTVREIVKQQGETPKSVRSDKKVIDEERLRRLYTECDGYAERVYEKLVEEEGIEVGYSTVTRMLRELCISVPEKQRCDEVPDQPGAEMQHDTSPYNVKLGERQVGVIASLLYLRYSKRRYLKFYRAFNRFKMKCFFHEALMFWQYSAPTCVIDNTNLARLKGIGKHAVMVPEMAEFGKRYGFAFLCHEKNHANRKAGDEKGLHTVETNFLPGRTFESLEDMNAQAFEWATNRMHNKPVGKTRVIPAEAFEYERPYLTKLSPYLPEPYRLHRRGTDQYGYAAFDGNYFWVPGIKRDDVKVIEYASRLIIYQNRECVAEYQLPLDGVKNKKVSPEGMSLPRYSPSHRKRPTKEEEQRLRAMDGAVDVFLDFVLPPLGVGRHGFIRKLFALSRKMTPSLFVRTIERAYKYRITSIETIESIALLLMRQETSDLPLVEVDGDFRHRETYLEGYLTDPPDLSVYENIVEEDDE
jgi:transposase